MSDYKPYRILRSIVAVVDDGDDTRAFYPHGKVASRMKATGKVAIVFDKGVIDAPTEEEITLFSLPALSGSVKGIPQDSRGFDSRLSGVARSVEGSQRGREKGIIEQHERKAAKVKSDLDKKTEPKVEAAPEVTTSEDSPVLIDDLEYLMQKRTDRLRLERHVHKEFLAAHIQRQIQNAAPIHIALQIAVFGF